MSTMMKIHSVILSVVLGFLAVMAAIVPNQAHAATKSFSMTAQQFSFSPSTITVSEGDTVNLSIKSVDVDHGFSISEFGVNTTLSAGKTTNVSFVADKQGTYTFFCSVYCGSGHSNMTGTLVVKAAGEDTGDDSSDSGDGTAPAISSISVSETDSGTTTITWETDEPAKGQVEYGTSAGTYIAATPEEGDTTTSHSATLTGLSGDTTYYYRVKSSDEEGNLARSSEASFTTEEEEESCDDLECDEGEKCEEVDGKAECVEDDEASCDDVECAEGEHCEVKEPEDCTGDECEAEAQCVSDDEDEEGDSSVTVSSIQTDTGSYTASSSDITLTDGE